jgi:polysaccharide export outer membrane protein
MIAQNWRRPGRPLAAWATGLCLLGTLAGGCSSLPDPPPEMSTAASPDETQSAYQIGPSDQISIFVWRQPELSAQVAVRPDGKISVPLIDDMLAAGKTPTELSQNIATALREYVQDPKVTVMVNSFVGPYDRQIRVVGQAVRPQAIPFRRNMSVLDVMIQVGGLTEYASGNRAVLVRTPATGEQQKYGLRLADLLEDGKASANVYVLPGDVIIIPQSYF